MREPKAIISWQVVLKDLAYQEMHWIKVVTAATASAAETKALKLQGPVNNGTGYVYNLQATSITLVSVAY